MRRGSQAASDHKTGQVLAEAVGDERIKSTDSVVAFRVLCCGLD